MSKWIETKKILDKMDREILYKGGKYMPKKRCFRSAGEINLRLQAIYLAMREFETTPEELSGKINPSQCATFHLDPQKAHYPQPMELCFSDEIDLDVDEG